MIVVMGKLKKALPGSKIAANSVLVVVGREKQQRRNAPDWMVCYAGEKVGGLLYVEETDIEVYEADATAKIVVYRTR